MVCISVLAWCTLDFGPRSDMYSPCSSGHPRQTGFDLTHDPFHVNLCVNGLILFGTLGAEFDMTTLIDIKNTETPDEHDKANQRTSTAAGAAHSLMPTALRLVSFIFCLFDKKLSITVLRTYEECMCGYGIMTSLPG